MESKQEENLSSANVSGGKSSMDDDQLQKLEQRTNWDGRRLVKYQGFWCPMPFFRPVLSAQKYFKAKDSDVILSSLPKSGTTWLKALTFSIANRSIYPSVDAQSPLLTCNPHKVVPFLELNLYLNEENPDLEQLLSGTPRILSTHMPFDALPDSIPESECKIIYITRNPLDQFVSFRHFSLQNKFGEDQAAPLELDEAFDMFCNGVHPFGPFCEHMIGYWDAHLKNPGKVLFLKYEDMKDDIAFHVRKIAEFMGCPFSLEEEKQGLVEEISRVCSFENLKNLEVNKNGYAINGIVKNSSYFRKGEVGDWANYLTSAMADQMEKVIRSKLEGSGLITVLINT